MSEPSSKLQTARVLAGAVVPLVLLWGVLVWALGIPYWITLAIAVPAGGVLGSTFAALRAPHVRPAAPAPDSDLEGPSSPG